MGKSVSIYVDDQELEILDRLAKEESRSRSAMLGEVLRRYASLSEGRSLRSHPLFRDFSSEQLSSFLDEDGRVPAEDVAALRRSFGLT